MSMNHTTKKIWLIGASAGIGKALAYTLAQQGHSLALSGRNQAALTTVAHNLTGDNHLICACDVSDNQAVKHTLDHILQQWSRIDSVIFMAGIYQPMTIEQPDIAQLDAIIKVNLNGAFYVTAACLPQLLMQGHGQLVLCASVAGYRGLPQSQPYAATKAGVINLAESLRAEHGKKLDIKLINPGFVKTRLTDKNSFRMPMRISTRQAATAIAAGLTTQRFEIHFPKRFTSILKLLRVCPYWLYFILIRKA